MIQLGTRWTNSFLPQTKSIERLTEVYGLPPSAHDMTVDAPSLAIVDTGRREAMPRVFPRESSFDPLQPTRCDTEFASVLRALFAAERLGGLIKGVPATLLLLRHGVHEIC